MYIPKPPEAHVVGRVTVPPDQVPGFRKQAWILGGITTAIVGSLLLIPSRPSIQQVCKQEILKRAKQECFDPSKPFNFQIGKTVYAAKIVGIWDTTPEAVKQVYPPSTQEPFTINASRQVNVNIEWSRRSLTGKPATTSEIEEIDLQRSDFIVSGKDKLACEPK